MNIQWEKPPPIAPVPKIPLYWINLENGLRSASMEKQIIQLKWKKSTRIQAFDGRIKSKAATETVPDFNFARTLVTNDALANIQTLSCAGHACKPTELATLLSHVRALRQAWKDGHAYALIVEDDVDLTLYDELSLERTMKHLPQHKWGSLQLYTGNDNLLEWLFTKLPPRRVVSKRNKEIQNSWSNACVLYNRQGMAKVLAMFGKEGPYRIPTISPKNATMEADIVIPYILGNEAYLSSRPFANVKTAKSTIDEKHDHKPMLADIVISTYAHRLDGSAVKARYGSEVEIARTASHLKALAHAYHSGLDRDIIPDHDLSVKHVNLLRVSKAIVAAAGRGSGGGVIVQLARSNEKEGDQIEFNHLLRAREAGTMGTSLYAVIGRDALLVHPWNQIDWRRGCVSSKGRQILTVLQRC
jgi:GR25 family glycosyltransferase involved in LPS biosynthesis